MKKLLLSVLKFYVSKVADLLTTLHAAVR